ncbi:MAG TPA: hypothetical protein VH268_03415 [Solirubrobacterales bacterium]|nr:hypothetical protein [Solirubrobacterales bacterium]
MNPPQTYPAEPATTGRTKWWARRLLNKVPEITLYFWVIKILCTTVGETFADNLNENLGLGLSGTSYIMGACLIVVLIFQFRSTRYVPGIYWLAVVLISVVGTLVSDNLVENYGVALETTTIAFAAILIVVFASWYASETTLSVHTIHTTKREAFYWLAILFTFALGTSAGDFLSEQLELGYLTALAIFAGAIVLVMILHFGLKLNAILSFWFAYILTRPLGASIGDYLASPTKEGGLGLGTNLTSIIFLSTILALVIFLAISKRDVIRPGAATRAAVGDGTPAVLVVLNKVEATQSLIDAVRRRAAVGPARFHVLIPNPAHLGFDRNDPDVSDGEALIARVLPRLRAPSSPEVSGRVANSPNAYDDIVEELESGPYDEVIIETPSSDLTHWLHIDLPTRVKELGYPTRAIPAAI